ncbi:MAG: hypothetical protein EXS05_12395 [Planctomycetaceae bacterium]|nr:hypothetical protein [Planctomycetaceae bacterium]
MRLIIIVCIGAVMIAASACCRTYIYRSIARQRDARSPFKYDPRFESVKKEILMRTRKAGNRAEWNLGPMGAEPIRNRLAGKRPGYNKPQPESCIFFVRAPDFGGVVYWNDGKTVRDFPELSEEGQAVLNAIIAEWAPKK